MSTRRSSSGRTAFASSSSTLGVIVATSAHALKEGRALDDVMKQVSSSYQALMSITQQQPVKGIIATAAPYHPPHTCYQNTEAFSRWSWFQDYIACKVTGPAGLHSMLPLEQIKQNATTTQREIDLQRDLFNDFSTLLQQAEPTHSGPDAGLIAEAITHFDRLKKDVIKLRNLAADISEGRAITTA